MNGPKPTYRYNHSTGKWDYIIKDFMAPGITVVIKHGEPQHPLTYRNGWDDPRLSDKYDHTYRLWDTNNVH